METIQKIKRDEYEALCCHPFQKTSCRCLLASLVLGQILPPKLATCRLLFLQFFGSKKGRGGWNRREGVKERDGLLMGFPNCPSRCPRAAQPTHKGTSSPGKCRLALPEMAQSLEIPCSLSAVSHFIQPQHSGAMTGTMKEFL